MGEDGVEEEPEKRDGLRVDRYGRGQCGGGGREP